MLLARSAFAGISFVGAEPRHIGVPDAVLAGHLDSDGRADLVILSSATRRVATYLAADTASHLVPHEILRVGEEPVAAALGDLNGDGRLDLVVADAARPSVFVLLGRGDGTLVCPAEFRVADSRRLIALALGNFDADGNLDIAVADDRRMRVFILRNSNELQPDFIRGGDLDIGDVPRDLRSVDLNGDGQLDLVAVNHGTRRTGELAVFVWRRAVEGFPDFHPVQRYTIGERLGPLTIGDFNRDGFQDAALLDLAHAGDTNNRLHIVRGSADVPLPALSTFTVECPSLTAGVPCHALAVGSGDFRNEGTTDLAVTSIDPHILTRNAPPGDAIQVLVGDNTGAFSPGPVFATMLRPTAVAVGDVTGDGLVDLVLASARERRLQVLVNRSTSGSVPLGKDCLVSAECVSDRCVNGVCCATTCEEDLVCNVPGNRGICIPVPAAAVACNPPGQHAPQCVEGVFCADGFCCNAECVGGRCNVAGAIGQCFAGVEGGAPCNEDEQCASGICGDNYVCCLTECADGHCIVDTGTCRASLPPAAPCDHDDECASGVCDVFDGICCQRRCDPDEEFCFPDTGVCRRFDYHPVPFETPHTPQVEPTRTPCALPAGPGASCSAADDCVPAHCVNEVCCREPDCGSQRHCAPGSGECVDGPLPATATPTSLPPLPTVDSCLGCPPDLCPGICDPTGPSGGGCSTIAGPVHARLAPFAIPLAMWLWPRRRRPPRP